jgi:hypothetical protein
MLAMLVSRCLGRKWWASIANIICADADLKQSQALKIIFDRQGIKPAGVRLVWVTD